MSITGNLPKKKVIKHTNKRIFDRLIFQSPQCNCDTVIKEQAPISQLLIPISHGTLAFVFHQTNHISRNTVWKHIWHIDFVNLGACLTNGNSNSHFMYIFSNTKAGQLPYPQPTNHLQSVTGITDKVVRQYLLYMVEFDLYNNKVKPNA